MMVCWFREKAHVVTPVPPPPPPSCTYQASTAKSLPGAVKGNGCVRADRDLRIPEKEPVTQCFLGEGGERRKGNTRTTGDGNGSHVLKDCSVRKLLVTEGHIWHADLLLSWSRGCSSISGKRTNAICIFGTNGVRILTARLDDGVPEG
jgi:hypothetical protein